MDDKLHILLADDDEVFVLLVRRALADSPEIARLHTLECVGDGAEALAYLRGEPPYDVRERHPFPGLVLLDQRMNGMDGVEALEEIKRDPRLAGLPVCLLTTSDEDKLKASCYSHGASFFVRKPLDYGQLKAKLQLLVRFFHEVLEVA